MMRAQDGATAVWFDIVWVNGEAKMKRGSSIVEPVMMWALLEDGGRIVGLVLGNGGLVIADKEDNFRGYIDDPEKVKALVQSYLSELNDDPTIAPADDEAEDAADDEDDDEADEDSDEDDDGDD